MQEKVFTYTSMLRFHNVNESLTCTSEHPLADVEITFAGLMDFPCSGIDRGVDKAAG